MQSIDHRSVLNFVNLKDISAELENQAIRSLNESALDLGKDSVEFTFGDIYNRPRLDVKSREIATIAALIALGTASFNWAFTVTPS